jgi:hypothetical protein
MKKFFLMLGIWLVAILTIIVGSGVYDKFRSSDYDAAALPYVEKAVTEISKWDPATTRELMVAEVASSIPEEDFTKGMAWFSKLGALQSMDEPEFQKAYVDQATEIGKYTIVEYSTDAKYANGEATINIKLLDRNGHYEVFSFNFSSKALLE